MRLTLVTIYVLLIVQAFFFAAFFAVAPDFKDMLELSTFEIGVSLTGLGVAVAVFALPAGLLIDRGGPRRLTAIGAVILLVAAVGHAVAVDIWSLLGARMLMGLATTIVFPAALTWLRDLVPSERRSMALSAVMPVVGIGASAGPVAAGAVTDWVGVRVAFVGIAVGLALSILLLLASEATPHLGTEPVAGPRVILSLLRREPLVLGGCAMVVVATLTEGLVNFLIPLQLDEQGISATWIGIYLAIGAAIFVFVGAVTTRFADRAVRLVVAGIASLAAAIVLAPLILSDGLTVLITIFIVRMALLGVLWTIAFPLGGLGASRAGLASGAIFGLFMAVIGVTGSVGTLAGGALANGPGFATAYAVLVSVLVVAALALLWLARWSSARELAPAAVRCRQL